MPPETVSDTIFGGAEAIHAELEGLYRSWRILDLVGETVANIPPAWLQILNVARNLLAGHPLPGLGDDLPADVSRLIRPPEQEWRTIVKTERKKRIVYPVTGDTEVRPLRNVGDLPQVMLPELMLRTLSPDIFDFMLVSGGINGLYNIEMGQAVEEYDAIVEERVPIASPLRRKRQKVYALLDVSNSMRDYNKIIFAKGLMLAYLITASGEQASLYFRTFGNTVHERTDCLDVPGFAALARRILSVTPDGSTDIQGAIGSAIGDIRALDNFNTLEKLSEAPPTEILLISDCESYSVPFIPQGIKLHTVHLKGGRMMTAYKEGFERIRAASATFNEIDTTAFDLPDSLRDRWLLQQDGVSLETQPFGGPERPGETRPEDAVRRKELMAAYEKMTQSASKRAVARIKLSGWNFMPSLGGMPKFSFFGVLRLIGEALGRLLHRGSGPGSAPPEHSLPPAFGVHFRPRR